ncbi:MAG TPA: hypothetical protein VGR69_01245 [Candidatus Rubrimentiphilum sp.]|nr:hypothetical protein [Candidatus Rubrimentiphilum sp.]
MRGVVALTICTLVLTGCGNRTGPTFPQGWKQSGNGTWVNPASPMQWLTISSQPFSGTLKDLASQTTINVVLRNRSAHFTGANTFSPCPGEAGLQTFRQDGKILQAAFSVWNGQAVTVVYSRPASAADDKAALAAMAGNVCQG